jgi:hypothetical protein
MSILRKIFMDPYQRSLQDPGDYDRLLDAGRISHDVEKSIRDPEARGLMLAEVSSLVERGVPVTIAHIVDDARSLKDELSRTYDRSLYEFGVGAHLGADMLAEHLIRRANQKRRAG